MSYKDSKETLNSSINVLSKIKNVL